MGGVVAPEMAAVLARARHAEGGGLVQFDASPDRIAQYCRGQMVYLASPVSRRLRAEIGGGDPFWHVQSRLVAELALDLDRLALAGVTAISPVLQALEMIAMRGVGMGDALAGSRGALDQDFWMRWSAPVLRAARAVVVVDRPGWRGSAGIAAECAWALDASRMVFFMGGADDAG